MVLSKSCWYVLFGFCLGLVHLTTLVQCCESSITGMVLKGYAYKSIITKDIFDCYYTCAKEEECQSLNYYRLSRKCQLNNRTMGYRPNHAQAEHEALYFNKPFRAAIGSSKTVPAVSCMELYNSNENAVSGRYWLLDKSWIPRKAYCNMTSGVLVECTEFPKLCLNGGTCEYHGRSMYRCACVPGFTGDHCEINIDDCSSKPKCSIKPCQNGGICKDKVNGYVCECPPLFTEKNCQLLKGAECKDYSNLTDFNRNIRYLGFPSNPICDYNLQTNWYRFTGSAGSRILDYSVGGRKCGANSPGWMDGENPTVLEGIVVRRVCFSWGANRCDYHHMIRVYNCSMFYVYELVKTRYCGRYCGRD